jgi:hypothetical protein
MGSLYRMLVGKPERKMSFERRKLILQKDKIETDMKYLGDNGGSGELRESLTKTIINIRITQKARNSLTSRLN